MLKRFAQHLVEGRDAPLYHAAPANLFAEIMRNNTLIGNSQGDKENHSVKQLGVGDGIKRGRLGKSAERMSDEYMRLYPRTHRTTVRGVSLTRSKSYAIHFMQGMWTGVVLELDQAKLSHTHKIIPTDYHVYGDEGWTIDRREEAEEFVPGDIGNIRSFIKKVYVLHPVIPIRGSSHGKSHLDNAKSTDQVFDLCKKYNLPLEEIH